MDSGQEVSGGFVVARCNGSELLELAVESLDEVALFVDFLVIAALDFAVCFRRDDRGFACDTERLDDATVGVVGFVCQQNVGLHEGQKCVGAVQVMGLAGGEREGERIAESVDQGMNLGAQSAFTASDRLVFFLAPALC